MLGGQPEGAQSGALLLFNVWALLGTGERGRDHVSPGRAHRLVLQDGSVWHGTSFGAAGTGVAEVVFNTALTGYQEILTDPSYRGQYVVFTHPHIGNTGINPGAGPGDCAAEALQAEQLL